MPATRQFDVVVIGAGAAGLMCAAAAGRRGRRVALLEHDAQPGRKILISGGGRCNFTNLHCAPANFLSENPHFAKSALALYQPQHFIELVESYRIPWHEKTLGQLFCDHSARAILDLLLAECTLGKVELVLNARDIAVECAPSAGFHVVSSQGEFNSGALVVATGGLSIPRLGATGLAYELARQFDLEIVLPRPALVPLSLGGDQACWTQLAGIAADVTAWAGGGRHQPRFHEKMLVTHRGLSGPAILQASSYWRPGQPLLVDFAPALAAQADLLAPLRQPGALRDASALRLALRAILPQRLAAFLAEVAPPQGWRNPALDACSHNLRNFAFHPIGTEGFEKAEVTAGGIHTAGLYPRTLEARKVSGLFFIGEAVDVTGHLGGFNFQWAWASAVAAARAL
jgi:predicted Rossmann fold flavoprotein